MKISILGSFRENSKTYKTTGNKAEFIEACKSIGRRLVQLNHTIILGSESDNTADFWVFLGAFEYLKLQPITLKHHFEIIRPNDEHRPFVTYYKEKPEFFLYHKRSQGWWQGAHLIALNNCDLMITIGGGKGTYIAGLSALINNNKLIPIASFGGASSVLLDEYSNYNSDFYKRYQVLNNPWADSVLNKLIEIALLDSPPKILIIHGRSKDNILLKDLLTTQFKLPNENIVILNQQNDFGKTIPEKFEALANTVDCAIAIATPDDIGKFKDDKDIKPRARQNVWIEVGWFWGRLGREKVMVLVKDEVEVPSDLVGIEYYKYTEEPNEQALKIKNFINNIKPINSAHNKGG